MKKKILLIILIIISLLTSCVYIISENDIIFIEPIETLAQDQKIDTIENIKEPETETEMEIESEIEIETEIESKIEIETKPEIIKYPIFYSDDTCEITIIKEWYENAWVYAAHLVFSDYDRFGTSCANGAYNFGYETTTKAAERIGAILTVNGCYSAPYLNYTVVRDGIIWNGAERNLCLPAIYSSNNGLLLSAWEVGGEKNVKELVDDGFLTDTFCFGPPILTNGEICVKLDNSRAQRTTIGTNGEAGDIWLIVSDGRWNDGESSGLSMYQCAKYLQSKECIFGVPLDGGGSTTMVWNGNVLNAVGEDNQRAVVDFVYFK